MGQGKIVGWTLALLLVPGTTWAHTIPAALGIGGSEDAALTTVRLSHGLATRDAQGRWRFVCPTLWGGPDTPLARAGVVVGAGGAYRVGPLGLRSIRGGTLLSSASVRRLVELEGQVYALAVDQSAAQLWVIEDDEARLAQTSTRSYVAIAAGADQLYTATVTGPFLKIQTWDSALRPLGEEQFSCPECEDHTVTLEWAGALYLRLARGSAQDLLRVEADGLRSLAQSTTPLLGPIDGAPAWVAIGGQLQRVDDQGLVPAMELERVSCLAESGTVRGACRGTELLPLGPEGSLGSPLFRMQDVEAPMLEGLDDLSRLGCQSEWLDFANEAGLAPAPMPTTLSEAPEALDPGGCRCAGAPAPGAASLLLLVLSLGCGGLGRQRRR